MAEDLKYIIYKTVTETNRKMTPGDVEKAVAEAAGVDRRKVRLAIRDLVGLRKLTYTYVYGTSFVERSFDRPVRLSKRIVIKPPKLAYQPRPGEIVVSIAQGAAFGNGAHPSTCLALRALDDAFSENRCAQLQTPLKGLDIGTGTGILAIALAKLGVQTVLGIDIDPCAVSEAAHNVSLNQVFEQVEISNTPLEDLTSQFSIIVANIAHPTLSRKAPFLSARTEANGMLILSGFKEYASKDVRESYTNQGLTFVREELDREWTCVVLRKPEQP